MSFARLAEFSSLTQPEAQPVLEAKKTAKHKFYAIQDFINTSLADLGDALGSEPGGHGTLYELEPLPAVAKLATALSTFKKQVEKVLTDIEVDIMADEATTTESLQSSGKPLTEGKNDYEDSADFTGELHEVSNHILNIKKVTRQPRWKNWMKSTDQNFDTTCEGLSADFEEKLKALDKSFDALEDELTSAS